MNYNPNNLTLAQEMILSTTALPELFPSTIPMNTSGFIKYEFLILWLQGLARFDETASPFMRHAIIRTINRKSQST
jgi:hypothetical protein